MSGLVNAVANVVNSIFGGNQQQAAAPAPAPVVVPPPKVMPTPDDEAIQKAKNKSIAAIVSRQGRASTILSGNDDTTLGV